MPQYNLTSTQRDIITSWLYEPHGYLQDLNNDSSENALGWVQANPTGNFLDDWWRVSSLDPGSEYDPQFWSELGMLWWILENDQVNIPRPGRPPEAEAWVATLQDWDASITRGLGRVPQGQRDSKAHDIYDESQQIAGTIPSGSHLAQQQQMITKVLSVLE